jgi:crotonobetainyl-CoA:carnitine CoA-transferase CaiB-like acyl-CoA transferase
LTPLQGLKVLDLTRLLPGPFCTMLLADLGADVIKVEEPTVGDPARHSSPRQGDTGSLFLLVNRNKRSLGLDLKTAAGRELLLQLVERADVLVESFRPGVMNRLGLDYDGVLAKRNPRLIYATLSGFGQSGPYRDRPGHDLNYMALAGVLGYNVDRQAPPVAFPPAVQVADLGGGTLGAVAILAAVLSRQQTGIGQAVDVSLFGSAIAWLPTLIASLFSQGRSPEPGQPPLAGGLPQYDIYTTADRRQVTLGALEPKFLLNFLERVGRPELAPLATGDRAQRQRLREELTAIFASRTRDAWTAHLADVDTCFAPVNTLEETLHDPQVDTLGLFTSVDHPRLGHLPQIGPPFMFSATPATIRRPPPDLGEHSAEILSELGLSPAEIRSLAERKIISPECFPAKRVSS